MRRYLLDTKIVGDYLNCRVLALELRAALASP